MKILCLHGVGTNASIFESQTGSFRNVLPAHYLYDFLEGEHDCSAADGIGEIYPGPYVSWYPWGPNTNQMADAQRMILDIVEEDGPFDGVIGFSQGAALAASILLHHEIDNNTEPPPFRFAVFICGSLPFTSSEGHGFDLTRIYTPCSDPMSGDIEQWKRAANGNSRPQFSYFDLPTSASWQSSSASSLADSSGALSSFSSVFSPPQTDPSCSSPPTCSTPNSLRLESVEKHSSISRRLSIELKASTGATVTGRSIRRFHPAVDGAKISIPTAHIYGKRDAYLGQSLELVRLCQADLVSVLDHCGAHEIPRSEAVSHSIADVIERTIVSSQSLF